MILFVVTEPFRRYFRPPRANDDIPVRPLVDIFLYWICGTFGGLCGSAGVVAFLISAYTGVELEPVEVVVLASITCIAPALLWIAFHSWYRLNHER